MVSDAGPFTELVPHVLEVVIHPPAIDRMAEAAAGPTTGTGLERAVPDHHVPMGFDAAWRFSSAPVRVRADGCVRKLLFQYLRYAINELELPPCESPKLVPLFFGQMSRYRYPPGTVPASVSLPRRLAVVAFAVRRRIALADEAHVGVGVRA